MNKKADIAFLGGVILVFLSLLILAAGLRAANFPENGSAWVPGVLFYAAPFICAAMLGSAFWLIKKANDIRNKANQENFE